MSFPSLPPGIGSGSAQNLPSARQVGRKGKGLADYEKPPLQTGEARLWRTLNSGDRVELIHGNHSRSGTIDVRTQDGRTVWIFLDHGMGRISVTQGDEIALVPSV